MRMSSAPSFVMARRMSSMSLRASTGKASQFGPARPRGAVADPAQVGPQAAHAAGRRARPGLLHPEPARPLVTDHPHIEEDDGRSRRIDAVLGFAEHAEEPCRADLDRALADTGPTRCAKHRRRRALRDDEPRRRSAGLPKPGDDPVQRRHRRHRLLLEERLLPGDRGGLDAGHGEALRHGAPDPAALAGQHELPRGGAVVAPRHRQRLAGRPPWHRRTLRPEPRPTRLRASEATPAALAFGATPHSTASWRRKAAKRSLLPEEGPARRARVPQHQIVHRPAAGEFGGRQEGPEPEPHHAHPRRPERAGGVDGEPDVPEPFGDEAGIGPASRRVPGGRVVDAKSGPAVAGQLMSERTQRPGRIGRLQTHAGADDGDPDGETVVGDVEPGEQRSVRWADPQREGLHRRDSTGLSRQVTRSESPVTLMETSAAWSGSDPTRRAGGRGTAVARLPAATRGGMHRRRP